MLKRLGFLSDAKRAWLQQLPKLSSSPSYSHATIAPIRMSELRRSFNAVEMEYLGVIALYVLLFTLLIVTAGRTLRKLGQTLIEELKDVGRSLSSAILEERFIPPLYIQCYNKSKISIPLNTLVYMTRPTFAPNMTPDIKSKIHSNNPSSPAPAAPLLLAIINDRDVVSRLDERFKLKPFELLGEHARAQKTRDPGSLNRRIKAPTMNL